MAKRKTKVEAAIDQAVLEPDETIGMGQVVVDHSGEVALTEEEPPAPAPREAAPDDGPDPTDPEWNDWVLSKFLPEELDPEGRPINDGLRRVVELVLGPIVECVPTVLKLPTQDDPGASAMVRVSIAWGESKLDIRVFGDAADVNAENIGSSRFLPFALATAVTRAESRAFRKALKLRKVLSADEVIIKAGSPAEPMAESNRGPGKLISEAQERGILKTCRDLKIDPLKFINTGKETYVNIKDVKWETAQKMAEFINGFLQDPASIPDSIKKAD